MPKFTRTIEFIQRNKRVFQAAKETLQVVSQAREGGLGSKMLAGMSVTGFLFDLAFPGEGPWDTVNNQGYKSLDLSIGGFIGEVLRDSDLPRTILSFGMTEQLMLFEHEKGSVAVCYSGGQYSWGPQTRPGGEAPLAAILQEMMWSKSNSLMLSVDTANLNAWKGTGKFYLLPMAQPGPYIGKTSPKILAERLRKYGKTPRTVLLRGPTGVGKSVMARHLAGELADGNARTLKIAASVVNKCNFDEILAFVRLLQPTILLLDDLALDVPEKTEGFLTLLEAVRDPNCLIIVTMMTNVERSKKPNPGDWHFPGMRPGRIDEIFTFYLPTKKERDQILRHYLSESRTKLPDEKTWKQIIKATKGLSGAYLSEVARRLSVHGMDMWESEIANVKLTAPVFGEGAPEPTPEGSEKGKRLRKAGHRIGRGSDQQPRMFKTVLPSLP